MPSPLLDELIADYQSVSTSQPSPCLGALATCEPEGQARVRTVVIHEITPEGVLLIVSSCHQKWIQLHHDPRAELLLWWPEIGVQYRLSGPCEELPPAVAEARWLKLPPAARQLDSAYGAEFLPGQPIESLAAMRETASIRSRGKDLTQMPNHVRAIRLVYREIERLEISPADRLHDRRSARLDDGEWKTQQLVP